MNQPLLAESLAIAVQLAQEAGKIARNTATTCPPQRKADRSLVTEVDHAMQAHIIDRLATRFPDHAFLAEESIANRAARLAPTDAQYCWVIDPLDGTRNFVANLPLFSTSIALLDRGRPILGVVVEHNIGLTYVATLGGGATLNGCPIRVIKPNQDDDLVVGVTTGRDSLTQGVLQAWSRERGLIFRNLGSTAVHLALVASGAFAADFCKKCKIWDIAAGALLITEAGGLITDPKGEARAPFSLTLPPETELPILAASSSVHARLLKLLKGGS